MKGSLSKWFLGDNIQTLTRGDMKRATEKLSDTLHLPMSKAKVGRIDLAKNLLMKFKPV
ncbi:MAG: phage/plasmid replication protein [Emticicia sp.]|nr:phage/plasmid replication protein [Emticicia sp.]